MGYWDWLRVFYWLDIDLLWWDELIYLGGEVIFIVRIYSEGGGRNNLKEKYRK